MVEKIIEELRCAQTIMREDQRNGRKHYHSALLALPRPTNFREFVTEDLKLSRNSVGYFVARAGTHGHKARLDLGLGVAAATYVPDVPKSLPQWPPMAWV
jgi:hypothetical protein